MGGADMKRKLSNYAFSGNSRLLEFFLPSSVRHYALTPQKNKGCVSHKCDNTRPQSHPMLLLSGERGTERNVYEMRDWKKATAFVPCLWGLWKHLAGKAGEKQEAGLGRLV